MRMKFDEQLARLNNELVEMGKRVERAIADANRAFISQDTELAREVISSDDDIDTMEKDIESLCLKIILQQQPVASDLRFVSSILKFITDLERIGDHATDISNISMSLAKIKYGVEMGYISQMAEATIKMVTDSVNAFVNRDADLARSVIDDDDKVDALFKKTKKTLISLVHENADYGDQAFDLILIAKYFERIGDHATNVAEWVLFSLTGAHKNIQIM